MCLSCIGSWPLEDRRHDMIIFRQSNLHLMRPEGLRIAGEQSYVYVESGFVMRPRMPVSLPYSSAAGPKQSIFNAVMSSARVVEWYYKDLEQQFTLNDFRRMLKGHKDPIALIFKAAAVMWNVNMYLNRRGR